MKPNTNAELIKALKDGATLQFKNNADEWIDFEMQGSEFRVIKTEPKLDFFVNLNLYVEESTDFSKKCHVYIDHYVQPNVQIKVDGKTGKLKSIKMLK